MRTDEAYWQLVERKAKELGTDGCSGLVQWYLRYCWEHDIHYRTHETVDGKPIGKWKSDAIFAWRHINHAPVGLVVGSVRWVGLTAAGWAAWYKEGRGSPVADACRGSHPPETP